MRAVDIIVKKREGERLTGEEIAWLVEAYVHGEVADYQMAAWAMAVLLRGMDAEETSELTLAMARSGEMLDLHDVAPLTVDKHSTGGVGDKTSLVLGPMCAAVGLPVAKMSGRGLGFSGGTLDKLEAIPGMQVDLTPEAFRRAVSTVGLVIAGQSADLAPADRQLYALRDVTGTVESIALIAASVMSKKLAAGADCIVLDVKAGRGAFLKTVDEARHLAQLMVAIGRAAGRRVAAAITSMEQPLGRAIGNAVEVREAIDTLQGRGPADLVELCCTLGAHLALLAGKVDSFGKGQRLMEGALRDGVAWDKFREFVINQGGAAQAIDDPSLLPHAAYQETIRSTATGFVTRIDSLALGLTVAEIGGGRRRKGDRIDQTVGVILERKVSGSVQHGDSLLTVHAPNQGTVDQIREQLQAAVEVAPEPMPAPPLIYETIS